MPQATTKTYQLFRETLLNATSEEHKSEIMELKFGCILKRKENLAYTQLIKVRPNNKEKPFLINDWDCGWSKEEIEDNFNIIGRDLTLEDVMIALKEKYYMYRVGKKAYFGSTMEDISQGAYWKGWQLTKPAQLQSEETLLEIINLLK